MRDARMALADTIRRRATQKSPTLENKVKSIENKISPAKKKKFTPLLSRFDRIGQDKRILRRELGNRAALMKRLETRQQAAIQAGDTASLKVLHRKRSTNNKKFDTTRRLKQLDNERNKVFVKMGRGSGSPSNCFPVPTAL